MTTERLDTISQRLRYARRARGYTQTRLAELAGIKQGTIGNIESPNSARTGLQSLAAIALALQISYPWLRDGEGAMELPKTGWPFSADLWEAVKALDVEGIRRAENALRGALDMGLLPKPLERKPHRA